MGEGGKVCRRGLGGLGGIGVGPESLLVAADDFVISPLLLESHERCRISLRTGKLSHATTRRCVCGDSGGKIGA